MSNWDQRYVDMAEFVAQWSKDPSTKTGAVVTIDGLVTAVGFNGLPRGIADTEERLNNRDLKYKLIVHCERNAVLSAHRSVVGSTLYTWPFPSCSTCAAMMIQAGVKRHVAPKVPDHLLERWGEDIDLAMAIYKEAGVEVVIL